MPKFKNVYTVYPEIHRRESYRSGFYHPISILILALITLTVALAIFANSGFFANKNVPTPSQTPQSSPKPSPAKSPVNETTNWKTYTNNKLSFSFKYPEDYFKYVDEGTNESEDGILLDMSIDPSVNRNFIKEIGMIVVVRKFNGSLEEFITQNPDYKSANQIIIVGQKAYKSLKVTSAQDPNTRENFLNSTYTGITKNNNLVYELNLSGNKGKTSIDIEKTFDQILSTFKFLN